MEIQTDEPLDCRLVRRLNVPRRFASSAAPTSGAQIDLGAMLTTEMTTSSSAIGWILAPQVATDLAQRVPTSSPPPILRTRPIC